MYAFRVHRGEKNSAQLAIDGNLTHVHHGKGATATVLAGVLETGKKGAV